MDVVHYLVYGFGVALQPMNLLLCFTGVFIGTLVGVLPGIGPPGAMALLLPVTYGISPRGCDYYAGGDLLWRDVRGIDHVDSGQHSRGTGLGGNLY